MKKWVKPVIEKLDIKGTEYSPNGGPIVDAYLKDERTDEIIQTLKGPSGGNSGDPIIVGNEL